LESDRAHPTTAEPPEAAPEAVEAGKKKRKTSRGLRDLQKINRRLTRTAHRLSRAVEKGIATYRERSEASAEKQRDGALRDLPRNAAEGLSVTLRKASRLPVDLVDAVDVPTTRRLVRFGTRVLLTPLSR
jgi:hypothetical protein